MNEAIDKILHPNVAGGSWKQKIKSRTLWIITGALAVASIPLIKAGDQYIGEALLGYAAVITALAGFSVFNKRQESMITYKAGDTEIVKDTRAGGDTNIVSGITGNVTKL